MRGEAVKQGIDYSGTERMRDGEKKRWRSTRQEKKGKHQHRNQK